MGKNKKDKKDDNLPKKVRPETYDWSRVDNLPGGCKEEIVVCPVCLERDGVERLGHYHHWCNSEVQKGDDIQFITVVVHTHFALYKNTKTPAIDEARNVFCEVHRSMRNKELYCQISIKGKRGKKLPKHLRDRLRDNRPD